MRGRMAHDKVKLSLKFCESRHKKRLSTENKLSAMQIKPNVELTTPFTRIENNKVFPTIARKELRITKAKRRVHARRRKEKRNGKTMRKSKKARQLM